MRADRLLSMLLLLQRHGRLTAQELARRLEVSERTVYRDLSALGSAGVPVYAERGPGGGCMLMDGYRTTLTGLNSPEAQTLFLAAPGPLADLGLGRAQEAALLKLLLALPSAQRQGAEHARERLHLDATGWAQMGEPTHHLRAIQDAVWQDRRLLIRYTKSEGQIVERIIEPLGLVAKAGVWYVVARQCPAGTGVEQREDAQGTAEAWESAELRVFRISRMLAVTPTNEPFLRPPDFHLAEYWAEWSASFKASWSRCPVTLRATEQGVALLPMVFGDGIRPLLDEAAPDEHGARIITLHFDDAEAAAGRLLSLGTLVEAIDPPEVRARIIALARDVLTFYTQEVASKALTE
ncbi:MAG: WYL domain-containing protein [Ktedonobacterales bacterium]